MASYAPFRDGAQTALGVETPVYRTGTVPATPAGRRAAFVGWLGELLTPTVVLAHALGGHPNMAVTFSYDSSFSHVSFTSGGAPARAQRTTIALHDGWSAQIAGAPVAGSVLDDRNALALLIGGTLLSVLFGMLVFVLGTGRRRALSLVNEKTRALVEQALHDPLTELPNRALVLDRAEQMLARAARERGLLPGALFVDIDGFKHVNDSSRARRRGQLAADHRRAPRQAVREQDTVGRLGGDEFVVLVESDAGEALVEQLAARLLESLREPIELDGGQRTFSVDGQRRRGARPLRHPRRAAAGRRPGAVRRQGGRPGPLRALRREHARERGRAGGAAIGAERGAASRRAVPALPAGVRPAPATR